MSYEPTFDFANSPTITIVCDNANDTITSQMLGEPQGYVHDPTDGDYHYTINIQQHSGGGVQHKTVECPTFTQAEASKTITIHTIVTNTSGGEHTRKKSTGNVPTGTIGGSPE